MAGIRQFSIQLSTLWIYVLAVVGNPAILCVLGNYLLISLKDAAEKGMTPGMSYESKSISAIEFCEVQRGSTLGVYGYLYREVNYRDSVSI